MQHFVLQARGAGVRTIAICTAHQNPRHAASATIKIHPERKCAYDGAPDPVCSESPLRG
jgi:hypothetical protein